MGGYTGLTLEESYGEGWIKPFHPDDRQRVGCLAAHEHRDTYSLECRLRRADGAYQWWLIRGECRCSAPTEIRKWFGTCTDIEQIKCIEQELRMPTHSWTQSSTFPSLFIKEPVVAVRQFNRAGEDRSAGRGKRL
jgi:PAS domain S-box-containing protein